MVSTGGLWTRYYLLTLSFTVFNLAFAAWSFWHYETESGQPLLTETERVASQGMSNDQSSRPGLAKMIKAFKSRIVILGALFIFAYQYVLF